MCKTAPKRSIKPLGKTVLNFCSIAANIGCNYFREKIMRHCFILAFVFGPVIVFAQDKTATPFVTPINQPFGEITSAKIDNKGGKLKSSDGGIEVIIPENALDAETNISIQSSHNDLNENDEGAYQLEPSGTNFKNPVQLIFHYKDDNDDLKDIAWQSEDGKWHHAKNIVVDSIQKTVSCFVSHFSKWAKFDRMYISPSAATVKVNKSKALKINIYKTDREKTLEEDVGLLESPFPTSNTDNDNDLLATPENGFHVKDWTANGIVNGDISTVGSVSKQGNNIAIYKAPTVVPSGNPVAVSVQIYSDKKNKKLLLTSNINVIGDQYHFTYIHIDENGCYFLVDSSSCIINMQKDKVSISNIINYKPWSDWPQCDKPCKTTWTNKESLKGVVEIIGITGSSVTPASEGALPNVNIAFAPAMGNTPSESVTCKDHSFNVPSMPRMADPKAINFDIDGDDVIIHYAGKTSRNELVLTAKEEKTMIYIYKVN